MSGLLHPVGPEPARTYWLRRALVLAVVAAVVVVGVALAGLTGGPRRAVPAAPRSTTPRVDATATVVANTAPAHRGASPRGSSSPSKRTTAQSRATPGSSPKPQRRPTPETCPTSRLRTSLNGPSLLKLAAPALFTVSVVNLSAQTCRVSVTADEFSLTIYSGRDRIWSSGDCPAAGAALRQQLSSRQTVTWQLRWDGIRSAPGCKTRTPAPRAGTYVATAQLKGGQPARLRMLLRG